PESLRRLPCRRRRSARRRAPQRHCVRVVPRSAGEARRGSWRDDAETPRGASALCALPRGQHGQVETVSRRRCEASRGRRELHHVPQAAQSQALVRPSMDTSRRDFLILGSKMFVMTSVAAAAFEHVLAGAPEAASTYNTADHWWAMVIDIEKCIG